MSFPGAFFLREGCKNVELENLREKRIMQLRSALSNKQAEQIDSRTIFPQPYDPT
jgi:hypothetical protein